MLGGAIVCCASAPDAAATTAADTTTAGPDVAPAPPARPSVRVRGLAYLDYSYTVSSPDGEVGDNTFDYRRLYLTVDGDLGDGFSARARLEAQGSSTTARGRPAPFVKDVWVRWDGAILDGHRLTLGVQPPPIIDLPESVWGYRSLDRTILDRVKANDSRDFGLRADGPISRGGTLRYSAMVANGNGLRPEDEGERGKHLYGRLSVHPEGPLVASLQADYTRFTEDDDTRHHSWKSSAFVGVETERFHGGVEAFLQETTLNEGEGDPTGGAGVSVFGTVATGPKTAVVARYDFVEADAARLDEDESYALAEFVYRPTPRVAIMPNGVLTKTPGADPHAEARLTVHVTF